MISKFFYLYLITGSLALALLVYQLFSQQVSKNNLWNFAGDIMLVIVLYYLAFKTYHEKKDKELM
jgi:hypothetical protein